MGFKRIVRQSKFLSSFLCLFLLTSLLTACDNPPPLPPLGGDNFSGPPESVAKTYHPRSVSQNLAPDALPTRVTAIDSDKLRALNVGVYHVGEDIMIVLPSRYFFYDNSAHVNPGYYPVLKEVIKYINRYDVETIKVAGYTREAGNDLRNVALSRQQAQNISKYLWGHGLDARYVYSIGYGGRFPIATNLTAEGRDLNNRVQITFRRLTPGS